MVVMSGNGIVLDGARDQVLNELQARHAKATGQVPQTVTEVAAL
jgi:hypothetical protein